MDKLFIQTVNRILDGKCPRCGIRSAFSSFRLERIYSGSTYFLDPHSACFCCYDDERDVTSLPLDEDCDKTPSGMRLGAERDHNTICTLCNKIYLHFMEE